MVISDVYMYKHIFPHRTRKCFNNLVQFHHKQLKEYSLMIEFDVFPNMKNRCVTFSFDVAHEKDMRIVSLLNKYGIKATLYLTDAVKLQKICELHKDCELSYNFANESCLNKENVRECIKEKKRLAEVCWNYTVKGTSVALRELDVDTKNSMKSCGMRYCRLSHPTMNCKVPDDFMEWNPSCNVKHAFEICDMFMYDYRNLPKAPLLHVWGKTSDLRSEEDWIKLEQIIGCLANKSAIWYATNTEVYEYISAQRNLLISEDEKSFYNPTNIDVWVRKNRTESFCIPAGRKISFQYF